VEIHLLNLCYAVRMGLQKIPSVSPLQRGGRDSYLKNRLGIYTLSIFLLILVLLFSAAGCRTAATRDTPAENDSTVRNPYELEKKLLPPEVRELFYAVKDSLDYAAVTGGIDGPLEDAAEGPPAENALSDYERVTSDLLSRLERKFVIERYAADQWNYELIVSRRSRPDEKYKATRERMYRWEKGGWDSIGPYLHR